MHRFLVLRTETLSVDVCPGGEGGGGAEGIRRILLNFVYKNIPLYRVMLCFWYCSNFKLCFQDLSLLHLTLLGGWGGGEGRERRRRNMILRSHSMSVRVRGCSVVCSGAHPHPTHPKKELRNSRKGGDVVYPLDFLSFFFFFSPLPPPIL